MKNESYQPHPIVTDEIELSEEILQLSEEIAQNVHEVWAASRIAEGWTWGAERNDSLKQHPCLISYEKLPEAEKEYDRQTAMQTLKLIQKLGFMIKKEEQ